MDNLSVRRYETLELGIEADDDSAVAVRFIASKDGTVFIDEEAPFNNDGEATIRVQEVDIPLGEYEYTLTLTYSDGTVDILPDASDCGDECDLPTLEVCKSNTPEVVS